MKRLLFPSRAGNPSLPSKPLVFFSRKVPACHIGHRAAPSVYVRRPEPTLPASFPARAGLVGAHFYDVPSGVGPPHIL